MDRREFLRTGAVAVGGITMAGCSGGGGGGELPENTVWMRGSGNSGPYYFDPVGMVVEPGATVTFEVQQGSHSSTAFAQNIQYSQRQRIPEDAESWNSLVIGQGETYDYTFEIEGTYDFFCISHKSQGMYGRVICGSPGGPAPADGSGLPFGTVPAAQAIVDNGPIRFDEWNSTTE